jgi:hypothetical protein
VVKKFREQKIFRLRSQGKTFNLTDFDLI